jgi:release factor glutamine methyltransferase
MSVSLSPHVLSAVVSRLRAAGCVYAEDEARLLLSTAATAADLAVMVDRRVAGLPLEHVVGWAEFCGLRIAMDSGVFVPRRRTEFLAGQAIARVRPGAVVVDLYCGSGAVGARRNLVACGGRVYEGDLYAPLPAWLHGRVDVLVANAPYVPTREVRLLPREARLYEPRVALDGGTDGLAVVRRASAAAPGWLAPGGHLLIEISQRQAPQAAETFIGDGLIARVASCEELSATVVIGTRPPLLESLDKRRG